jgi:hypothetical protein
MQDIDFDEIDKAVSSSLKPSQPASSQPVTNESQPSAASRPVAPAARRSGRFMDVVHPSSDMRTVGSERAVLEARAPVEPVNFDPVPDPQPVAQPAPAPEPTEPLESPFISDAKVEKRPLGAFSAFKKSIAVEAAPKPSQPEQEEELLLEAPDEERIEAHSTVAPTVPTPVISKPAEKAPDAGPSSINQQYKEQPSSTDQSSGAIYDTEAYHQPLAHPAKKKSSLIIIGWIVGLIVIGAGAGAAVYFFVLPLL